MKLGTYVSTKHVMYIYACIKDYVSKKYDIDDMIKKGVSRLTDSERPAELDPAKLNDLVLVCGSGDGWMVDACFLCVLLFGFYLRFIMQNTDQHLPE